MAYWRQASLALLIWLSCFTCIPHLAFAVDVRVRFNDSISLGRSRPINLDCSYDLSNTADKMGVLVWEFNGQAMYYYYYNDEDRSGPSDPYTERLVDYDLISQTKHSMIFLDPNWCDDIGFYKCTIYSEGLNYLGENRTYISGNKDESSLSPVEEPDRTGCYNSDTEIPISCWAMWHTNQINVTLRATTQNATSVAGGDPIGTNCTHLAVAELDGMLSYPGEEATFECDIEFENVTEYTLSTTVRACSGPPVEPTNLRSQGICTSRSITLEWTPGQDGGENQTFVLSYYKATEPSDSHSVSIPDIDGSIITYTVTDLEREETYEFNLTATNIIGSSGWQVIQDSTLGMSRNGHSGKGRNGQLSREPITEM